MRAVPVPRIFPTVSPPPSDEPEVSARRSIIVIGGGEHARVVMDCIRSRPDLWSLEGFVDPHPAPEAVERFTIPHLGDDDMISPHAHGRWFVIGVGSVGVARVRSRIAERYTAAGARWAVVVHASAWVSPSAHLGPGTVVCAGAIVNTGATVGAHCVVNTGAIVEHDVQLGDFVQVGPGAALGGGAVASHGAYLGLGCRVRDHVRIGARTVVGMGSVVIGSVGDEQTVVGVPARPLLPRTSG